MASTDNVGQALPARITRELLADQSRILERAARGAPLLEVLADLCRMVEDPDEGMRCTVLLIEDGRVRHCAAPGVPASYTDAIEGAAIGPNAGSCGTAAYLGEPVLVDDIATDPKWEPWRDAALAHGLRACWSLPVKDDEGRVVATFAAYADTPRMPTTDEYDLLQFAAHLASIVLSQARWRDELESMAARLSQANEELRRADRAKDDFLSLTSHELRTPLTPIRGVLETLRARWDELGEQRRRDLVEILARHTNRMAHLVDDLLTMSVVTTGNLATSPEDVNVEAAVAEAIAGVHASDRTVLQDTPSDLVVTVDPDHLQQILINYLSNALKYAPEGTITIRAAPRDDTVHVEVVDQGPGVPPELVSTVFEPFTQLDAGDGPAARGTGLGLSVVRALARVNHGHAWCRSADGGGACFGVALPAPG